MPEVKLKQLHCKFICIHWTAGSYIGSTADFRHYHFNVGKDGKIDKGQFSPFNNIPPLHNGKYAAHCGGGNSYCIGVALRGMSGYSRPGKCGRYPLTRAQGEAAWELVALLCKEHGIPVTAETVFTHYEYGKRHPDSDSAGKIDITHLPYEPDLKPDEVGDYIRGKVRWYLQKLNNTMPGGKP